MSDLIGNPEDRVSHNEAHLLQVVVKGTVFARMSPDQKGQLVESLQDLG